MPKDKYDQYFEMPPAILKMISECSPHGFLLFYIDNAGQPQVKVEFATQITEMGLRAFAGKILAGIDEVEDSGITDNIFKKMFNQEDEDSTS